MTRTRDAKAKMFGLGLLALLLALVAGGALLLWLLSGRLGAGAIAAAVGWILAGALAVLGWWTTRLALLTGQQGFIKVVFGGLLLRLLLAGVAAGVAIGANLVEPTGFVVGLLVGVVVFQTVEVALLSSAARQAQAAPASGPGSA